MLLSVGPRIVIERENNDKVKGMLYGVALGDALGMPYEFCRKKEINYEGTMKETKFQSRFVKKTYPCGAISDDTEMTIALLNSLKGNNGKYQKEKAIKHYLHWANSGGTMIGVNTRALFRGIKTLKGYESRAKKIFSEKVSQANGCLMRCSPLALIEDNEKRKKAVETDVDITNPIDVCRQIVYLHVELLHMAIKGYKREVLQKWIEKQEMLKVVKEAFEQGKNKKIRDVSGKTKGWIVHAFYCAIYSLYHINNFTDMTHFVINLRGDTDTNCSIAGGLIGALLGYSTLYKEQENNIKTMREVKFDRPKEYNVKNLDLEVYLR